MTRNSEKDREVCLAAHGFQWNGSLHVKCHVCALLLNTSTKNWQADHIKRHAEYDGPDARSGANIWPICVPCHKAKSAKDTSEIAKGKRIGKRHNGIKRARGFAKPKGAKFDWSAGRYVREKE